METCQCPCWLPRGVEQVITLFQTWSSLTVIDEVIVSRNATVFEFNPWEMGSWDPQVLGMAPMRYVGSEFDNGKLKGSCVRGFDNLGFVMGTSSSLWNEFAVALLGTSGDGILAGIIQKVHDFATGLAKTEDDIANWTPNPFYKWNEEKNKAHSAKSLTLADGGEDYQNVP
jgi:lysophospholipase